MKKLKLILLFTTLVLIISLPAHAAVSAAQAAETTPAPAQAMGASEYAIDQAHSSIAFAVKHMAVSTTRGMFTDYEGTISYDKDGYNNFKADVTIQAKSINTGNEKRDTHLKSDDFLGAEKFPTITFKSEKLERQGEVLAIVGDLTIHGVTKTVTIPVEISGPVDGPMGQAIGLSGHTTINRKDFGVNWSKTLDNGGLMVADNVDILIDIEAHKK